MRVVVLGSGSQGNSLIVELGNRRLIVDAGFSCRELERRVRSVGIDPDAFDALLLTHEHGDHVRGAARFARRHCLPIYATEGTLEEVALSDEVRSSAVTLRSGEPKAIGEFQVEPFLVPHDAREPVGLVIEDGAGHRLGLVADLGSPSRLAWGRLRDLDVLVMETNHDLEMLRHGPYPWPVKQRVAGRHGHLSNREAAENLPELVSDRLRHVVLYHLSRTNNLPALALAAVGEALHECDSPAETTVTFQDEPSAWLEV
jgi:phosphoribosyl 1,2-cyclic phosphodiesterase